MRFREPLLALTLILAAGLQTWAAADAAEQRPQQDRQQRPEGQGEGQGQGHQRRQPPPEAFSACKGKQEGASASFTSPRGDNVTGTCARFGERLALRPDRPPPEMEGGGPPEGMERR